MKKILILSLLVFAFSTPAQEKKWNEDREKVPDSSVNEFQAFAYFITQAVSSNFYANNDLLKGQIIGRLFSSNTTITGENPFYFEQRLLPLFIYQPKLLNNKALLRTSFEIDWTWGDASYGAGGNFGSAFSGDQVNIQTQNVELELIPLKNMAINIGLQRLFDTAYNPYRTFVSTMLTTGYRLMYWGSDGVGVSVRYDEDFWRVKGGYYQLYENNVHQQDDVVFWEAIFETDVTNNWRQGFSLWYVADQANGEGGVSILSEGLRSQLADYNGAYRFKEITASYLADIVWLGTYWNYNPEFKLRGFSFNGFVVNNIGWVRQINDEGFYQDKLNMFGIGANLRAGYRYGQTAEDVITIDLLYSTGDEDASRIDDPDTRNIDESAGRDDHYSGVITGNQWGSPGGLNINTGAYILYPHGNVVNRYISAISDLSNMGFGHFGGVMNISKGIIPNLLYAKIGFGAAISNVSSPEGGKTIGAELNGKIGFQPAVFMNVEIHAAYMWLGDFYNSRYVNGFNTEKPVDPFTVFAVFKWLMF